MNTSTSSVRNIVSTFLLVFPMLSWANPPHDFPCAGPDKPPFAGHKPEAFNSDHLPPYLDGLDLSDSQQVKISGIVKTQGIQRHEKAEILRKAHDALRKLTFSVDYNDEKAQSFAEASARYMAELATVQARLDHEIFTVLNAKQQQQVQDNMAKFKGHFLPH